MLFPTVQFILFFILIYVLSLKLRENKLVYSLYLILVNFIYYYFFGLNGVFILGSNVIVNYLFLILLKYKKNKKLLIIALLWNIGVLLYYKYTNFFLDDLFSAFPDLSGILKIEIELIAPIGLSFVTFRYISHLVDFYKGGVKFPSFIDFTLYVTAFWQICAGPIERAKSFYEDLEKVGYSLYKDKEYYLRITFLIISGLLKKYVVASYLFNYTSNPFSLPSSFNSLDLVFAALSYAFLIFADFSGYSDLSNAIALLMGFGETKNFDSPYAATSISEFWGRWHISLSSFIRDYIYIPLGGNRVGKLRQLGNIFTAMAISGLWHGANLTFIVWGSLYGLFLGFEKVTGFDKVKNKIIRSLGWIYTFTSVTFLWIFFTSPTLQKAQDFISGILAFEKGTNLIYSKKLLVILVLFFLYQLSEKKLEVHFRLLMKKTNLIVQVIIMVAIFSAIILFGPERMAPFIYFQF